MPFPVIILPPRIHPSPGDCLTLFGADKAKELTEKRARDYRDAGLKVTLTGPGGEMRNVPVYFPLSETGTAVALTLGGARGIGLNAPVCVNPGDCPTPGVTVTGPAGSLSPASGVYVPQRRLLLRPKGANDPYLREGDSAFVAPVLSNAPTKPEGTRTLIFGEVKVLYTADFTQGFYIDPEEAAAANMADGDPVRVVGKPTQPEFRSDRNINRRSRLVTEADVRRAVMAKQTITVEPWMIVTPAARELGNARKTLVYKR